jgi:4-hydroxybenzoyl-CoA thioesterase/acyl-CoA thioester hydrolase
MTDNCNQALRFVHDKRVEFADTDMAGLVHFSNMLRYMEETEYAFLRSLGLSVVLDDERGKLGFPRVNVQCDYLRPARFEDLLTTELTVEKNDGKCLVYVFVTRRETTEIARGQFTVVCCRFPPDAEPYAIPIPDRVLKLIPLIGE